MRKEQSRYAVVYLPDEGGFTAVKLTKGETIKKQYRKNTSIVRASSVSQAIKKLSQKSYKEETGELLAEFEKKKNNKMWEDLK